VLGAVPSQAKVVQDRDRHALTALTLLMIQDSRLVLVLACQQVTQALIHNSTTASIVVTEVVAPARTLHYFFCKRANRFPTTDLNKGRTNSTKYFVKNFPSLLKYPWNDNLGAEFMRTA